MDFKDRPGISEMSRFGLIVPKARDLVRRATVYGAPITFDRGPG